MSVQWVDYFGWLDVLKRSVSGGIAVLWIMSLMVWQGVMERVSVQLAAYLGCGSWLAGSFVTE